MADSLYRSLDFSKLMFSEKRVTTREALADVTPFRLSKDVILGKKQVTVSAPDENRKK